VFALATHGCSLRKFQRLCKVIGFQVATSAHVYLCTHLLIYNVVIKRYIDVDVYVFEPRQTRNRTRIQVCLPIPPNLSSCLTQSRSSGCDLSTAVLKLSMLGDVVCCAHICTHCTPLLNVMRKQGFTEIPKKDGKPHTPQARSDDGGDGSPIKRSPLKTAGQLLTSAAAAHCGVILCSSSRCRVGAEQGIRRSTAEAAAEAAASSTATAAAAAAAAATATAGPCWQCQGILLGLQPRHMQVPAPCCCFNCIKLISFISRGANCRFLHAGSTTSVPAAFVVELCQASPAVASRPEPQSN
jgi:hypothetical protein